MMPRQFAPARRRKEWRSLPKSSMAFGAASTVNASQLAFTDAATVLRMLGEYTIAPSSAPAITDGAQITVAIGVISSDAAATTTVPDLGAELEYPWLYWASHPLFYRTVTVSQELGSGVVRVRFDVRSQRKMKPRESLVMIADYENLSGDPALAFYVGVTRVLVALP